MVVIPTFIIGVFMIYLGGLASIFKIVGDMLEEEKSRTYYIKTVGKVSPRTWACPEGRPA